MSQDSLDQDQREALISPMVLGMHADEAPLLGKFRRALGR